MGYSMCQKDNVKGDEMTQSCWPRHTECGHRDYIGMAVKLNGKDATICCTEEGFALVAQVRGPVKCEWSWMAVYNITANHGGQFSA